MKRKSQLPGMHILEELQKVIECVTDRGCLTWDELRETAYRWCIRDYEHGTALAARLGVVPAALTHAALLFIEHPLLVRPGGGWIYGPLRSRIAILHVMAFDLPVEVPDFGKVIHIHPQPSTEVIHTFPQLELEPVDNSELST